MVSEPEKERIRLVESELTQTNEFVKGVIATGAAIRGSAITIWLALIGFAVQQKLAELGLLAAIVSIVFWTADTYHGWLYAEASKHGRVVERLLSTYYNALSRADDDPDVMLMFRRDLRAHRFGLYSNLRDFKLRQLREARPWLFYRVLYPFLVAVALVSWLLIGHGVLGRTSEAPPTRVVIEQAPPATSTAPSSSNPPLPGG